MREVRGGLGVGDARAQRVQHGGRRLAAAAQVEN
jgi:hypothetical protein